MCSTSWRRIRLNCRRLSCQLFYTLVLISSGLFMLHVREFRQLNFALGNETLQILPKHATSNSSHENKDSSKSSEAPEVSPKVTPWDETNVIQKKICMDIIKEFLSRPINPPKAKGRVCDIFDAEAKLDRDIVINVFNRRKNSSSEGDITLVTQLTLGRLDRLEELLNHWPGPVSAAIYLDGKDSKATEEICNSPTLKLRDNVFIHLMRKSGTLYPVNHLRNLALSAVHTEYVFLTDGDFITHKDVYSSAKTLLAKMPSVEKKAFIVPAFGVLETKSNKRQSRQVKFPETKEELLQLWDKNVIEPVHFKKFIHGHFQTNYTMWRTATEPYLINWYVHYEPYIILRTKETPMYDTRFIERYFDKVSQIYEVHKSGFEFYGIPNVYMVHMPHDVSTKINRYWRCATLLYNKFVKEINDRYSSS